MVTRLKQSTAREAYLNLGLAHERLFAEFSALFRGHGLTQAQFNVLRILIDGPEDGAPCQHIGEHLLNRVPDVTRLIDRMEAGGLVLRRRSAEDRRVVLVRITAKGRKLCEQLYKPVNDLHRRQFAHLSDRQLESLNRSLLQVLNEA